MTNVVTLIADPQAAALDDSTVAAAQGALADAGAAPGAADWLAPGLACDVAAGGGDAAALEDAVRRRLADRPVDVVVQPAAGRRKRLLVADMESTIIANEFVDELADALGVGAEVREITAQTVRGERDFAATLRQRVGMLAGLPVAVLDGVLENLAITPGAGELVATMRAHGAVTALVSGGFTRFSGPVRERLGFDRDYANVLEAADGKLTGRVAEPIVDRAGKRAVLEALCAEHGIAPGEAIAVGDGANDIDMVAAAGMGVAFRARPALAKAARARIDHGDLTALLYLQGYRRDAFAH